MNKYTISLLLSFVWLTVCGVTCHPYGDDACGGAKFILMTKHV